MNLSYTQMGISQNYYQNNSLSFKNKQAVNVFSKRLVRCKETYYPKGKEPLWKDLLAQFTEGSARKEESYYPTQEERIFGLALNRGINKKTVYYDAQGHEMATVYDVNGMGKHNHLTLHTPDRDYTDWGKTGTVNCYREDQLVDTPSISSGLPYIKDIKLSSDHFRPITPGNPRPPRISNGGFNKKV